MKPGDPIDRYTIERVIGEGGMSVVYLARHNRLRSLHALKVLQVDGSSIRKRLLIEGRVQASLKHPNVVSVTDVIEDGTRLALVMEYVDGPTLYTKIHEPMPLDVALELFRGIASGVGAAHAAGLVHRDLKPANVLLASTNVGVVAKVTDFGLVKVLSENATRSGVMMGTPNYMSPEQVKDASTVDPRSDLWALGVILYEMLTACTPFGGDNHLQTYNRIATADMIPVQSLREGLPDRVVDTVNKLLTVDLEQRFQSADEALTFLFGEAALQPSAINPDRFRDSLFTPGTAPLRGPTQDAPSPLESQNTPPETPTVSRSSGPSGAIWATLLTSLALGALVLAALIALVVYRFSFAPVPPTQRDVDLGIVGAGQDTSVAVYWNDQWYPRSGDGLLILPAVPVGDVTLQWTTGDGCTTPPCPDGCTEWCVTGETPITVEAGEGQQSLSMIVSTIGHRMVTLETETPLSEAWLGGESAQIQDGKATFDAVEPGRRLLVVNTGTCPEEALGCSEDADLDCPTGCRSIAHVVTIPASTQAMTLPIDIDPVHEAVRTRRPRIPARVTGDAFAAWIEGHPEWERDAAIDSGRVNRRYLRNWTPSPPGGAVTHVTFEAASAYCATRGGLRAADATPQLWTGGPDEEWRSLNGAAAALRRDGQVTPDEPTDRASPDRGFRCAR